MPYQFTAGHLATELRETMEVPDNFVQAIRSYLLDHKSARYTDCTLIGHDGTRVRAVRPLLCARSVILKHLFTSSDSTQAPSEIVLDVPKALLHNLVEFAYTDDATLLRRARNVARRANTRGDAAAIRMTARRHPKFDLDQLNIQEALRPISMEPAEIASLLAFVALGLRMQMPALVASATHAAINLLDAVPRVACLLLETSRRFPSVSTDSVAKRVIAKAWEMMRKHTVDVLLVEDYHRTRRRELDPRSCLLLPTHRKEFRDAGVLLLSCDTLEAVLKDKDLFVSESYLLQVLYYWATEGGLVYHLRGKTAPQHTESKKEGPKGGQASKGDVSGKKTPRKRLRSSDSMDVEITKQDSGLTSEPDKSSGPESTDKPVGPSSTSNAASGSRGEQLAATTRSHVDRIPYVSKQSSGDKNGENVAANAGHEVKDEIGSAQEQIRGMPSHRKKAAGGTSEPCEGDKHPDRRKRRKTGPTRIADDALSIRTEDPALSKSERFEKAKQLVRHINLERLKPSFMMEYVEKTGLVDRSKCGEVYRQQALEAERGRSLYDGFRGGSVWGTGKKTLRVDRNVFGYTSHVLASPWIRGGRHEWAFRLDLEGLEQTWFGVSAVVPRPSLFFGAQPTGWAYSTRGACMECGRRVERRGPKIEVGQTVRIILNLVRNGTLTILVEGTKKSFKAFSDLKGFGMQLLPVVALAHPTRLTLVSERHMME